MITTMWVSDRWSDDEIAAAFAQAGGVVGQTERGMEFPLPVELVVETKEDVVDLGRKVAVRLRDRVALLDGKHRGWVLVLPDQGVWQVDHNEGDEDFTREKEIGAVAPFQAVESERRRVVAPQRLPTTGSESRGWRQSRIQPAGKRVLAAKAKVGVGPGTRRPAEVTGTGRTGQSKRRG